MTTEIITSHIVLSKTIQLRKQFIHRGMNRRVGWGRWPPPPILKYIVLLLYMDYYYAFASALSPSTKVSFLRLCYCMYMYDQNMPNY